MKLHWIGSRAPSSGVQPSACCAHFRNSGPEAFEPEARSFRARRPSTTRTGCGVRDHVEVVHWQADITLCHT